MEAPTGSGNEVLRYLAILKAARDFGLAHQEIAAVAGRFDPRDARCDELADALADLILARTPALQPGRYAPDGLMFWFSRNRFAGS